MSNILLYTIGNHDVTLSGLPASEIRDSFREMTRDALDELDRNPDGILDSSRYKFELLDTLLDYIGSHGTRLHRVVFFATDQDESVPMRIKDTIYAAELMKKYLLEKLGPEIGVDIHRITNSPHDFDTMYDYFFRYYDSEVTGSNDNYIVCTTAGIPAVSNSLKTIFSNIPHQTKLLYIEHGTGRVNNLQLLRTMYYRGWQKRLKDLVASYNYGYAAKVAREEGLPGGDSLANLLDVMGYVENFCLEEGLEKLEVYMKKIDAFSVPVPLADLLDFCRGVTRDEDVRALQLLCAVMKVRRDTGKMSEAVALMFRLREAVLKYMAGKTAGVDFDEPQQKVYAELCAVKGMAEYLNDQYKHWSTSQPNHRLYDNVLKFYAGQNHKNQKQLVDTRSFAAKIIKRDFDKLRHHGPYAHGFEGVTKAQAEVAFGSDFVDEAERFLKNTSGIEPYNPFSEMTEYLCAEIDSILDAG